MFIVNYVLYGPAHLSPAYSGYVCGPLNENEFDIPGFKLLVSLCL